MNKFLLLHVLLPVLLIACGGGGDPVAPTIPTPTPEPLPVVSLSAVPDSCTIPINKGMCEVTLTYNTSNTSKVSLISGQGKTLSTNLHDSLIVTVAEGKNVFSLDAKGAGGSTLTSLLVTASCEAPSILDTKTSLCSIPTNICESGKEWNNALKMCISTSNTKVEIAKQLPLGCITWKDECWSVAIKNGTVKFISSSVLIETDKRNIIFAYFRNTTNMFGVSGMWNLLPFYADTGHAFDQDISGGTVEEIDWVYGNNIGAIAHIKSSNTCIQFSLNSISKTFTSSPTTCPEGTIIPTPTPTCLPPAVSDGNGNCVSPQPTPVPECLSPLISDGNGHCVLPLPTPECLSPLVSDGSGHCILPLPISIPAPEPTPLCVTPTVSDGFGHCVLPLPGTGKS